MGLRISTNSASLITQRNIEKVNEEVKKSFARLSSGEKIVNASDDAAGLAISKNLEAEVRGLRQAQRNANDGVSFVQTAEGALNEVSNILIRLRELGVQASSDTVGDGERSMIDREYQVLKSEIDRISQVTNYNGRNLLDGSGKDLSFHVGTRAGEENVIKFSPQENNVSTSSLGISSAGVVDRGSAMDSLESVDKALEQVSLFRSDLGAVQNRLHAASNNLGVYVENVSEARSRIADTDIAVEASNLAKQSIIQSAGISVLAQANASASNALKLV
ncbi:MAG: flagellin FliC [Oligoflexia bacterium]|nr:flagellin FliC [Oligoflexia bacterium]